MCLLSTIYLEFFLNFTLTKKRSQNNDFSYKVEHIGLEPITFRLPV